MVARQAARRLLECRWADQQKNFSEGRENSELRAASFAHLAGFHSALPRSAAAFGVPARAFTGADRQSVPSSADTSMPTRFGRSPRGAMVVDGSVRRAEREVLPTLCAVGSSALIIRPPARSRPTRVCSGRAPAAWPGGIAASDRAMLSHRTAAARKARAADMADVSPTTGRETG